MGILDNLKSKHALVQENKEQKTTIDEQAAKIAEQKRKIKSLEQIKLKVQNKVYSTAELDRIISENKKLKDFQKFHAQLQEKINIIRGLDYLFERKGANNNNSKDAKNNVVFSLLQLRNLLNSTYCVLSDKNVQFQVNTLKELNRDGDKEIEDLISSLSKKLNVNNELLLKIEDSSYNNSVTLYQKIFKNIYDKDIDRIPKKYYFGTEEDKHF